MSRNIGIHLWIESHDQLVLFESFARMLDCIAMPQHIDSHRVVPKRFGQVSVFDLDISYMIVNRELNTNDVQKVIEVIQEYKGLAVSYRVDSAYDVYLYDSRNQELEETVAPLEINYFGPNYQWKGVSHKSYGPLVVYFYGASNFKSIERQVAIGKSDFNDIKQIITKVGQNYDVVRNLAKRLIMTLNPAHLLICTDTEVSALTSHAIYHSNWRDYLIDLERIARLHEQGGVYFTEFDWDDPILRGSSLEPRKKSDGYGYLRSLLEYDYNAFRGKLDALVDGVLSNPQRLKMTTREQVESAFSQLVLTNVEEIDNTFYLSAVGSPFAYLEEPYFGLCKEIYS